MARFCLVRTVLSCPEPVIFQQRIAIKMSNDTRRQSTGVEGLDERLGGGLIPGTLTVVVGATGIGKTQMGVQFAGAGQQEDERPGIIFDMCARGDSQSHADYAQRICGWDLQVADAKCAGHLEDFFAEDRSHAHYLQIFGYQGRRVTRNELDFYEWNDWQAQLNTRLAGAIAFFYGNFVQGVSRVVVDGIEPVDRAADSIQLNLFEYIYHQILRKEPLWVARDLFRQHFRQFASQAEQHVYDSSRIGCQLLCTSHETMLEDLIARPLEQGDVLSNANTLIYMGKIKDGNCIRRALYIPKHRGSACTEDIVPYTIDEQGVHVG